MPIDIDISGDGDGVKDTADAGSFSELRRKSRATVPLRKIAPAGLATFGIISVP
jgi:hypothetical protein